jgi:hypothetical protein
MMKHNRSSIALLVAFMMVVAAFSASQTGAQRLALASSPLGAGFTYQGKLLRGGNPANATCDFQFGLWDAATAGSQLGTIQTASGVVVVNGLFTVVLDFGNQFSGSASWLATAVKCADDGDFTALVPRQALTAAPYALGLQPGAHIDGAIAPGSTSEASLRVSNSSSGGIGIYSSAPSGIGVHGSGGTRAGVLGTTSDLNGSGVEGNASGSNAAGVFGVNTSGPGLWGRGTSGGSGVYGQSSGYAVYGDSSGGFGVYGTSTNGGVVGMAYVGVQGNANGTTDSQGVRGDNGGSNTVGYAGLFNGRVSVFGNLNVYGTLAKSAGAFRIDHPLDPANKYLSHSFVESPDMKNIYDGVATLGADGTAIVTLPSYFEALNMDFRYQLTCIGGYAPVYVAQEIAANQFSIAGGRPGLKVSWQVTGTRHDPYAEQNRIIVEEDKAANERGRYVYPSAYGQAAENRLPLAGASALPAGVSTVLAEQPDGR